MIKLKSKEEIEKLRVGGKKLAKILQLTAKEVRPGISTDYLNDFAHKLMIKENARPAFLGFIPVGANRPYPGSICISINDEIVHGIPNEDPVEIKEGDVVGIDAGLIYEGLYTDHAITISVGEVSKEIKNLLSRTQEALNAGIKAARPGNTTGDIGAAIQVVAEEAKLSIIQNLSGHGVGYGVHEEPFIPNEGRKGTGEILKEGMVIAIEPMFSLGSSEIILDKDGYTYKTKDGSISAQFEHTVAITVNGPEILTK